MNMAAFGGSRSDLDQLVERFLGSRPESKWPTGGYEVPTDVFHTEDKLVISLDLPGVNPDDVEVTVQENVLLINGKRHFRHNADSVRFVRRGTFYGEFTQRVALGKGLDVDRISARYDVGVLELSIPYAPEVQPKRIPINGGGKTALSG
ncbi:MAG: Hsp20/alpha crystallin family protein [Actinomycetota bacterium]|nr:Hsp20/alpha crystallin family protein [Actinomycetota bacterium]